MIKNALPIIVAVLVALLIANMIDKTLAKSGKKTLFLS